MKGKKAIREALKQPWLYNDEELDGGAIIEQSRVPICPGDTVETLTHRIQRAEYRLLPMVINNYESKESIKESTRAALAL